ncbi:Ceramide glucosyltransferase [Acidisarcina polymorpha]|uniref:Ceramide glucosyltransferase n=1 Tax=Acidisarcina polymorpha TaxID=2211140 RepID=A0A2Z5G2D4_9BACT|nr:glycosyltransferase [Acidisarcina polymorpha]AXC13258.1 Ceramide glucosyltransferase [Acidisarcina polymorpha]
MLTFTVRDILIGIAAIPFIYYAIALFSSIRFFLGSRAASPVGFTPPISNLKPVRGLDPDAYENYASFCRQDYPDYEVLFCVGDTTDPVLPVLQRLTRDFPDCKIRIVIGSGRTATNDKVAKLARMVDEAAYEHLVISDSDVRVEPDYLRRLIAPLSDPKVGAVTCFYVPTEETSWVQRLQDVGMLSDFYPGILVAKQLDGVKFALGPTIATTRARLHAFGGYSAIENQPADDLLVGRLIAEQGCEVVLLPYAITTVPDYQSLSELFYKRLRWITVMRHMRPWGHLGLIFTLGLPWALMAVAVDPTPAIAVTYLGGYFVVRAALTALVGGWGLKQKGVWKKLAWIPVWDAMASLIWLASFARRTIRWRGRDYLIRNGELVPLLPAEPHANAGSEVIP